MKLSFLSGFQAFLLMLEIESALQWRWLRDSRRLDRKIRQ